jgi:hypothetical protein
VVIGTVPVMNDDLETVRLPAYGIGEHMEVQVPPDLVGRVEALSSVTSYGPDYQRRVVDTLVDLSHLARVGERELVEQRLSYCERIAGLRP